ncbi:MAG: hypothetical protein GX308_05245 [Epulopiscium sp.]|nr:hypothetical protein [Candidatus Epulonipiscium sp.]
MRGRKLIEIQTANFGAIKNKIKNLCTNYPVRLVYPIYEEKWILTVDENGRILRKRKSPKKGTIFDLFNELIRCPWLINEKNFSLEVLFIKAEEIRCQDGKGSWRRKGLSIKDRKLLDVNHSIIFNNKEDFLPLIHKDIPQPFTNRMFSQYLDITISQATRATYCFKKMKCIKEVGKKGNAILYSKDPF